jgi:hypothetical protein
MSRRLLLTAPTLAALLLASLWTTAGPVLAAPCDGSTTSLQNGGFETPVPRALSQFGQYDFDTQAVTIAPCSITGNTAQCGRHPDRAARVGPYCRHRRAFEHTGGCPA